MNRGTLIPERPLEVINAHGETMGKLGTALFIDYFLLTIDYLGATMY
jgi:hypothetical protein